MFSPAYFLLLATFTLWALTSTASVFSFQLQRSNYNRNTR